MASGFEVSPVGIQKMQLVRELRESNELTGRFGLTLSERQIQEIAEKRTEALSDNGRIEFGRGIIKDILYAFCDSPYVTQENYEETILELIDSFYYFKNEADDMISDEDLIEYMRRHFNGVCQGSLEYLNGTTLSELCRNTRHGARVDSDHMRMF